MSRNAVKVLSNAEVEASFPQDTVYSLEKEGLSVGGDIAASVNAGKKLILE